MGSGSQVMGSGSSGDADGSQAWRLKGSPVSRGRGSGEGGAHAAEGAASQFQTGETQGSPCRVGPQAAGGCA